MKIAKITSLALGLLFSLVSFSQNALQKANSKAANTANDVSTTAQTANDVKNAVSGLFKKKKGKMEEAEKSQEKTPAIDSILRSPAITISIIGIDYAGLKAFENNLKSVKGVSAVSKKFNSTASSLEVSFAGKGDQLWDLLPTSLSNLFTLKDLGDQAINLEMKK